MKPSAETVDAIDRLLNIPEFREFIKWVEAEAGDAGRAAIYAPDSNADVLRGRAQFGLDLLEAVHRNPDRVARITRRNSVR